MSQPALEDIFEFWTPSEIQTYVNNVAAGYHALAGDFKLGILEAPEEKAWSTDLANFLTFYKNLGFFSKLSMAAVRSAEQYATKLRYWRDIFESKTGRKATGSPVVIPAEDQDKTAATIKMALIVAGLGACAWFGIEALKTVRVFKSVG